jgi:hypothetical protein
MVEQIVKGMKTSSTKTMSTKLSAVQMQKLVEKVFAAWKKSEIITFKEDEKKVFARAIEVVKQDYIREAELDRDVHAMLDKLEETNSGEFQRYKMFPILKQKLAKERKVIL